MKRIRLQCEKCKYEIEISEIDMMDYTNCLLCNGRMIYKETQPEIETDNMKEVADKIITLGLEREINLCGNYFVYNVIEQMTNAETRGRYRKYFLLAGGKIQEQKIFKEINGEYYV